MSSLFTARFPSLQLSPDTAPSVVARPSSPPVYPTDETLLTMVSTGDEDALAALFRRYAKLVRAVGRRMLRDSGEADDLVQDVFLYVHRKGKLFDQGKGSGRSWIFQVVHTQALMRRRRLKSQGLYVSVMTDGSAEREPDWTKGVEYELTVEGLFGRNGWKNVWDSLTDCQRATLQLHFYEGCTFAEIAERLGQSYVNIRHHYYRGLERLRRHADENELKWP
jgi:RNA polymerase sigma-70 factor, ECF subfamily